MHTESSYDVLKQLGFEECNRSQTLEKLYELNPGGGTALRDSILAGLQIVSKIDQEHKRLRLKDDYNIIHIVMTDGKDQNSKTSEYLIGKLLRIWNHNYGNSLCQTVLVGIGLNSKTDKDLKKLCSYAGKSFKTFNTEIDSFCDVFNKISEDFGIKTDIDIAIDGNEIVETHHITQLYVTRRKKVALIFNLDFSASMKGLKWESLKENAMKFVEKLTPSDLLKCLLFSNEVKAFEDVYDYHKRFGDFISSLENLEESKEPPGFNKQRCTPSPNEPIRKAIANEKTQPQMKKSVSKPANYDHIQSRYKNEKNYPDRKVSNSTEVKKNIPVHNKNNIKASNSPQPNRSMSQNKNPPSKSYKNLPTKSNQDTHINNAKNNIKNKSPTFEKSFKSNTLINQQIKGNSPVQKRNNVQAFKSPPENKLIKQKNESSSDSEIDLPVKLYPEFSIKNLTSKLENIPSILEKNPKNNSSINQPIKENIPVQNKSNLKALNSYTNSNSKSNEDSYIKDVKNNIQNKPPVVEKGFNDKSSINQRSKSQPGNKSVLRKNNSSSESETELPIKLSPDPSNNIFTSKILNKPPVIEKSANSKSSIKKPFRENTRVNYHSPFNSKKNPLPSKVPPENKPILQIKNSSSDSKTDLPIKLNSDPPINIESGIIKHKPPIVENPNNKLTMDINPIKNKCEPENKNSLLRSEPKNVPLLQNDKKSDTNHPIKSNLDSSINNPSIKPQINPQNAVSSPVPEKNYAKYNPLVCPPKEPDLNALKLENQTPLHQPNEEVTFGLKIFSPTNKITYQLYHPPDKNYILVPSYTNDKSNLLLPQSADSSSIILNIENNSLPEPESKFPAESKVENKKIKSRQKSKTESTPSSVPVKFCKESIDDPDINQLNDTYVYVENSYCDGETCIKKDEIIPTSLSSTKCFDKAKNSELIKAISEKDSNDKCKNIRRFCKCCKSCNLL